MKESGKERSYRVVSFLKRQELDFLDDLSKDIYFSYGINIPRTRLIEEIIEAFREKETLDKTQMQEMLVTRVRGDNQK